MTAEISKTVVQTPKAEEWHALGADETLQRLRTLAEHGLTSEEAQSRLQEFGPNQLDEAPPPSFWKMLWEQFNNFVVIMLIVAAVISAVLGEYVEAAAIMAIVVLNAALGVIQERRAEQSLAALRKLAAPEAQVIRDGSRKTVSSLEVVPGDMVLLESGNFVPADVRLVDAVNLRVEEAALTGESVPVQKDAGLRLEPNAPLGDRKNTAFMGTVINYGRGRGVVVATGMRTQIGMIATMLQNVETEPTPLQRRLDQLGKILGWAAMAICALVFLVGWARGNPPLEMFITAVSLAIAAVPEGLPAVVTITLALGMQEMVKRHALIRRLSSVETLGSATVICSDKTGTLTQNEMTATRTWVDGEFFAISGSGYTPQGEFLRNGQAVDLDKFPGVRTNLWVAALNNDAGLERSGISEEKQTFRMVGDPTEGALIVAAAKAGARYENLNAAFPRVQEVPFDSNRKRMITIHRIEQPQTQDASPLENGENRGHYAIMVKGAPDLVLNLCSHYQKLDNEQAPLEEAQRMHILTANDLMTQDALRVLGMGYKIVGELPGIEDLDALEKDLIFSGLIGMIDPPRPEVPPALEKGKHAGIRTVMITGDYPNTARAIAEAIGLLAPGHQVLTGPELNDMNDADLRKQAKVTDVFARVSPEHKLRIVEALRAEGRGRGYDRRRRE